MAELDFAAWTASIGNNLADQRSITTAGQIQAWETEVVRDRVYTLTNSNTRAQVTDAGRYLVRYDFGIRDNPFAGGTITRAAVLSTMRLANVEQVWGRALGYWRNAQQCSSGHVSAAAILSLAASDEVSVHALRIDTAGSAGRTIRDNTFEGQLSLWRLKDSWRVLRAKLAADGSSTTTTPATLTFGTVEQSDAGWGTSGDTFTFDPAAAGEPYASELAYLFLVCVTVEADLTSGTGEGEIEIAVQYAPETSGTPTLADRAYSTSYAENVNGCTKVVAGWAGLVTGLNGEHVTPDGRALERLAVTIRHRNSTTAAFTPRSGKASVQIVAIPRSQLALANAGEQTGGQAADVDGALAFDSTFGLEDSTQLDHDPAGDGSTSTKVRAVGIGAWVLAFASGYAYPNGSRSANRLNHRLQLNRAGAGLAQCGAVAHNRGTNGCDRGGVNAHGIVRLTNGQDLEAFHDQLSNQTDSVVDWSGPVSPSTIGPCKLQAIRLRLLGQLPDPVLLGVVAPTVARLVTVLPSSVPLPLVAPAVTRTLQLVPAPALLGVVSPAVARLVTLLPSPVPLGLVAAQVARLVTVTPQPVVLPLFVPSVARLVTVVPGAAAVALVVPAVARLLTLVPAAAELELVAPPVTRLQHQNPGPALVGLTLPPAAVLQHQNPSPALVGVVAPPVLRALELVPSPAVVGVVPPAVTRLLTMTPDPALVGVVAPSVLRLVTLTPTPVELLVFAPAVAVGTIVVLELALELVRAAALPAGLELSAGLAVHLERAVVAQARLARGLEGGAELPTGPELDALLVLAADMPAQVVTELDAEAQARDLAELRASVNRTALALVALEGAAAIHADFARVLARVVRVE